MRLIFWVMHATHIPENGPKFKLVEAAEKLFADKGFEAVSVRDITKLAGANVAAVNYHFGSRDGLMAVVISRFITPVTEERMLRLEQAERKWAGKVVPVEEVVDAFVRPLVTQVRRSELSERLYCKLLGRVSSSSEEGMSAEIEAQFSKVIDLMTKMLSRSLPSLSTEELLWRIHFMCGAIAHVLVHQEALFRLTKGASGNPSVETLLSRYVRFISAGLREGAKEEEPAQKAPQGLFNF